MLRSLKILMIWLVLINASQALRSKEYIQPWLKSQQKLDLCSSLSYEREVLFTIELDTILKTDNFYGLNFSIKYDPGVVDDITFGTINTMFDQFEVKDYRYSPTDSTIYGYAGNISNNLPPLYGTKPFLAIGAKFKGTCEDTAKFTIEYIEFTDEFTKEVSGYKNLAIPGKIPEKDGRILKIKAETDTLKFDTDVINENRSLTLQIESKFKTEGELIVQNLSQNYKINKVESLNTAIEIMALNKLEDNKYSIDYRVNLPINNVIKIDIQELKKDSMENTIYFENKIIQNCSCILSAESTNIVVKSWKTQKDTTDISVDDENKKFNIEYDASEYRITSPYYLIKDVKIIDILGDIVNCNISLDVYSFTVEDNLPKGIYLFVIRDMNNDIHTIKIAK